MSTTYRLRREDGTIHTAGLTEDAVVRFAECLGFDAVRFRTNLTRRGVVGLSDEVGELTAESETLPKKEGKVYSRSNFYYCMVGGVEYGPWRHIDEAKAGRKLELARAAKRATAS